MDAANEAPAPDAEPAAPPVAAIDPIDAPEPIAAIAPIDPIDAPAPPEPIAPPALVPEASPPVAPSATELADAALAFQPTRFRAVVIQPFWAGLLGGGVGMWVGCALHAYSLAYIIDRQGFPIAVLLPLVLALGAALWRGYRAPVQSYKALFGRVVGALFFGAMSAGLTTAIMAVIFDGLHIRDQSAFTLLALMAGVLAGLALARLHGIGPDRARRIKIGSVAAAVLLVTLWPVVPSLRCRLGFGEGCREAYSSQSDLRSAGLLAQRGCELENAYSCRLAGQHFQSLGSTRDLREAEGFFREGCALGDPESCDGVHELELLQRCDRYGAFACAELARAHESGDGMTRDRALAQRYYRKACLLGADDACREANGR
jgi:hypothetical protein